MIEYANESVIKSLKQYDMLSKSLKFTTDLEQKQDICYQMTRIIERVLNITNSIYEEKYRKILNRSTYLMDEERNRLLELINLINERRTYINNQINNNLDITGISLDSGSVLGEDKLEEYKEQVKIIEKYKNNTKQDRILKDEIVSLENNIKKANNKINSNRSLNRQLEERMISILTKAFTKLSLFELREREKEIDLAYTELGYSLEKAKENAKIARKDCSPEIILECDNMLASITLEYERYKEKKLILRLIEMYKDPVKSYEDILKKREEINGILLGIASSDLYLEVGGELNKQYATIKLEQQDITTLKSLKEELELKRRTLDDINRENNSDEFKGILATLLENEKKYQEHLLLEKKKREEERKREELEREKLKRQEMVRRQKALEEERKKEIEERTKQLLVEKKNPVLSTSKDNSSTEKKSSLKKNNIFGNKSNQKEGSSNDNSRVKKNINSAYGINIKPSDDIFSREIKNTRKVDEGIPVVRNNKFDNNVVSVKERSVKEEVFPKMKLNKEEEIFPDFPELNDDNSFFDADEFKNLNEHMEDENKKGWF